MAETRPALPPLRDVIARYGLAASKALGQNFLLDEQLLDRIAAIPGTLDGQPAFEVGHPLREREEILCAARENPSIGFRQTFVERADTGQIVLEDGEASGWRGVLRRRRSPHERQDPECEA